MSPNGRTQADIYYRRFKFRGDEERGEKTVVDGDGAEHTAKIVHKLIRSCLPRHQPGLWRAEIFGRSPSDLPCLIVVWFVRLFPSITWFFLQFLSQTARGNFAAQTDKFLELIGKICVHFKLVCRKISRIPGSGIKIPHVSSIIWAACVRARMFSRLNATLSYFSELNVKISMV